jgi:hypothetical protein
MKYKIHRLCRDNNKISELKKEEKKFNLPTTEYVTGIDLFTFINNIIENCPDEYALIVHDDVILPTNISDNVESCIKSADTYLGKDNWGVIGNAGVKVFTKEVILYLSDPNTKMIVPSTGHPELVESIDGNIMLLNLKNIRREKVSLPKNLTGFHLYDLILSFEIQRSNLLCAVSSLLYSRHSSGGSRENFQKSLKEEMFQDYFSENFSNSIITTINGEINVNKQIESNHEKTIEDIVSDNIIEVFKDRAFKLFFVIDLDKNDTEIYQLLESIKDLKAQVSDKIDIKAIFLISESTTEDEKSLFEKIPSSYNFIATPPIYIKDRHDYFDKLSDRIKPDKNTFFSIIRNDYVVLPNWGPYIQYYLSSSKLVVSANKSSDRVEHNNTQIQQLLSGNPKDSVNCIRSMIFSSTLLERLAEKKLFVPRGLENYVIFLCSVKNQNHKIVNTPFYKTPDFINNDENILSYQYTTVMSQLVNENLIPQGFFEFFSAREGHWQSLIDQLYFEFNSFKQKFVWKAWKKCRDIQRSFKKNPR